MGIRAGTDGDPEPQIQLFMRKGWEKTEQLELGNKWKGVIGPWIGAWTLTG